MQGVWGRATPPAGSARGGARSHPRPAQSVDSGERDGYRLFVEPTRKYYAQDAQGSARGKVRSEPCSNASAKAKGSSERTWLSRNKFRIFANKAAPHS